jgi:hypothetical protein
MSRLSLRLPESLHQQLAFQARREGVSLNHYLVFLLSRYSGPAWSARPAQESAEEQRAAFGRLRRQLGSASPEENRRALEELREPGPEDPELTPELLERWEHLRAARRQSER